MVGRDVFEAWRPDIGKRHGFWKFAVLAKETPRSMRAQIAAVQIRTQRRGAGPLVSALDQVVLDRVRQDVCHLRHDVVWAEELDDGGRLGGPEVLPATSQGVLMLGEQLVKGL